MDNAKQHWKILQKLGNDLENRVREFLVIGRNRDGVILVTESGEGYWFGKIKFGVDELNFANEPTPLDVPGGLVHIAQSDSHILLLNKRGQIYSIGKNDYGQLGLGKVNYETHFSPQLISIPHKFISVRCGYWHSLALTDDGKVWAWGDNKCCQVGVQCFIRFLPSPHQIPELNPYRVVAVECGDSHSLALTDQGEVYAWGKNVSRQLGLRYKLFTHIPTQIHTPSPVRSMAAGQSHTLLLTQTGEVWACGENICSQLGLPTTTKSSASLVKVAGLPPILQIASHLASDLSIAMSSNQRCFVWGLLRNGTTIFTPRELPPVYSTVESPLSFYSTYRSTPHSVSIPETLPNLLSARMSRMFDNPETSPDVQFVVEQRTIHAHRIILSNLSDYFAHLFSKKWKVLVDPGDTIVKVTIPDHSYKAFYAFLRFLYTDFLEVHPDLIPEVFELARQYLESDLQQLCISRMYTTLNLATCCLYYPLTHRHSQLPELAAFQQELVQFASTQMWTIVHTDAFKSMEDELCKKLTFSTSIHSP